MDNDLQKDRLFSEAAERNKAPIFEALKNYLPTTGDVLEIASGTGQHIDFFSRNRPDLDWQPSDQDQRYIQSIEAYQKDNPHFRLPIWLNVLDEWWTRRFNFLICINMIHIAPFEVVPALFKGASEVLAKGDRLFLYGPFRFKDRELEPSNVVFDESLRSKDSRFGVRAKEDVESIAEENAFDLEAEIAMPANNHSLIFKRIS